jgi:hypothetical protein
VARAVPLDERDRHAAQRAERHGRRRLAERRVAFDGLHVLEPQQIPGAAAADDADARRLFS